MFATPGLMESIGSEEDKAAALAVARESIVLLKNNRSVLPLAKGMRVLVTGKGCDSLSHQTGGWSIHWQGAENWEFPYGTTIYEGLVARLGAENVTLLVDAQIEDGDWDGDGEMDDPSDDDQEAGQRRPPRRRALAAKAAFRAQLAAAARSEAVDAVVACVGEHPYAEKPGCVAWVLDFLGVLFDVAAFWGY